jgi:hypothetical protein
MYRALAYQLAGICPVLKTFTVRFRIVNDAVLIVLGITLKIFIIAISIILVILGILLYVNYDGPYRDIIIGLLSVMLVAGDLLRFSVCVQDHKEN